jgi:hypothetical protein
MDDKLSELRAERDFLERRLLALERNCAWWAWPVRPVTAQLA